MKGIIFNLLEGFVVENYGDQTYEKLIDSCSLKTKGEFVGPGTYPDEDLFEMVTQAVKMTGIPSGVLIEAFGKFCFPKLAERFPQFVKPYSHPKDFLKTIHSVIHVEVKKLYKDAETPIFSYKEPSPTELILVYKSKRKLCALVNGLLNGVSEYYKSSVSFHQSQCMLKGAPTCDYQISFTVTQAKPLRANVA